MQRATRYLERRMVKDVARVTDGRYRRVRVDDTNLGRRRLLAGEGRLGPGHGPVARERWTSSTSRRAWGSCASSPATGGRR